MNDFKYKIIKCAVDFAIVILNGIKSVFQKEKSS